MTCVWPTRSSYIKFYPKTSCTPYRKSFQVFLLKKYLEILKGKVECFGRFFQRKYFKKYLENDQYQKSLNKSSKIPWIWRGHKMQKKWTLPLAKRSLKILSLAKRSLKMLVFFNLAVKNTNLVFITLIDYSGKSFDIESNDNIHVLHMTLTTHHK